MRARKGYLEKQLASQLPRVYTGARDSANRTDGPQCPVCLEMPGGGDRPMTDNPSNPALKQSSHPVRSRSQTLAHKVQNSSAIALGGIALASALLYWLVFARPYSLIDLSDRPLLDLWKLSKGDPLARWRLLGGLLAQGALYWLGWRVSRHARGRAAWAIVLTGALLSGAVLLFLYPFDAADVFDNIMQGRILGVYGANPGQSHEGGFRQCAP